MSDSLQAHRESYKGPKAEHYEAARTHKPVWSIEQQAIADTVHLGPVLDIPVGTGRYLPIYRDKGLRVTGIDYSPDMLKQAAKREYGTLLQGSILDIPFPDQAFASSVCTRLMNWLEPELCQQAIGELLRVSRETIVSIRIGEQVEMSTITHTWDTVLDALDGRWIADKRVLLDEGERGIYYLLTIRQPTMEDVLAQFQWNKDSVKAFTKLHVEWCERYRVPVFDPQSVRCEYLTGREIYRRLRVMAEVESRLLAEHSPNILNPPNGDGPITWVDYGKGFGQLDGRHRVHMRREADERFPVFILR